MGAPLSGVKVFSFRALEGSVLVSPAPLTGDVLVRRAGIRQGPSWTPSPVTLVTREDGRDRIDVDCPGFAYALPVIKTRALPRVQDHLAPYVEFLPLDCPQEPLTAVNVLTVVDALDEDASELERFPDGRIMMMDRYAFRSERVPAHGLFKLPGLLRMGTFCTEPTADYLNERLTGLNLVVEWEG